MSDINKAVARLEEICGSEGTEIGEYWGSLVNLYNYKNIAGPNLVIALESQIIHEAQSSYDDFELVDQVETTPRVFKVLKYKGEF